MAEDDSQKTEQPTGRKLGQARQRGQVVQSREVNSLFMLSTGAVIVLLLAPMVVGRVSNVLTRFLDPASLMSGGGILWDAVLALLRQIALVMVLPILLLVVAAVAGTMVQTGFLIATERIGFDLNRLNPISGFSRLFSLRSAIEFIKNFGKFLAVAALLAWLVMPETSRLPLVTGMAMPGLLGEIHHMVLRLAIAVLVVLAVLSVLDYGYQRFAFMQSMRMSKQEVKEENRQSEGDPAVKMRLRQIRLERARKRMMAAVPTASVVVTNPTHYAVALAYEMGSKGAPKVVAKGADFLAQRIREIAQANDVPLVENPPLARALYATVDLDREIPPEHYKAVAEIISYVFRLKGKLKQN